MTISNSAFAPYVYEIQYEAVDGTFSGTFLQGANTIDSSPGDAYMDDSVYVDATEFYKFTHSTTAASAENILNPFVVNIVKPSVARIQAAHGPVPFRMIATRVYVTPATYSTSP